MGYMSIPGMNHDNTRVARPSVKDLADSNPNFAEYRKNKGKFTDTGMDIGEKVMADGEPGVVRHEEYDQHSGTVRQIVQRSSQTGSGTREVVWENAGPNRQRLVSSRRIFS